MPARAAQRACTLASVSRAVVSLDMRTRQGRGIGAAEAEAPARPQPAAGPELTAEQREALTAIREAPPGFRCHLLDGVTGSGKTEVYMCLLERVLAAGDQALVLVPEIGLTPQLLRRFSQRLGLEPVVIHSGLAAGERMAAWEAMRSGRGALLVGTRSALFTPMPRLRLLLATALREGAEEMRLNPLGVGFQGMLPPEHLVMFNRTIYPMVGWVQRQQRFFPNWEVERIVRIPVRALLVPTDYIRLRLTMAHHAPAVEGGGRAGGPCTVTTKEISQRS